MIHTGNKQRLIKDTLKRTRGSLDPSELRMATRGSLHGQVALTLILEDERYPVVECVECWGMGERFDFGRLASCWACDGTGIMKTEAAERLKQEKAVA